MKTATLCQPKNGTVPKIVQALSDIGGAQGATMDSSRALRRDNEDGFTLIDMLFVVAVLTVLMSLAIPGLMRARSAAQASSALGTIRTVNGAQLSYAIGCGLGFYAPDLPTLGKKPTAGGDPFLTPELSSGPTVVRSGYTFSLAGTAMAGAPATCNGLGIGASAPGYALVADPLDVKASPYYFGTNADGVIYQHTATFSATMPENGPPPSGAPIK
jgi:type II secretory pathway pseudopilin PulG